MLNNGLSLKSLAADLLNIPLDKSLGLRCSNWEAENLSREQVEYLLSFVTLQKIYLLIYNNFPVY